MSTKTINSWDWDVRVRERNLKNGILAEKDVEKMLSALPDVSDKVERVSLAQPAMHAGAAPLADEGDEEDDEEDEADGEVQ